MKEYIFLNLPNEQVRKFKIESNTFKAFKPITVISKEMGAV